MTDRRFQAPWTERLEEALRHVTNGQRLIDQQRDIIKRMKALGRDTTQSEKLLAEFEVHNRYLRTI